MRFLVLQHEPHEGPGRYERFAHEAGIELDTVRLWDSESRMPLRNQYGDYSAALIMGGSNGVNQPSHEYPRRDEEIDFIHLFGKPILGTCLGSQLINYAHDGAIYKGTKECGFYEVDLTFAGRNLPIFSGIDYLPRVFHWHGDSCRITSFANPLATAHAMPNDVQAFAYGNKIGVLWHWEMTPEMIDALVRTDREFLKGAVTPWAEPEKVIPGLAIEYNDVMERNANTLFTNFVRLTHEQAL